MLGLFLRLLNVGELLRGEVSNNLIVFLVYSLFLIIIFSFIIILRLFLRGFFFSHFRNLIKFLPLFSFILQLLLHLVLLVQLRVLLNHLHYLLFFSHWCSSRLFNSLHFSSCSHWPSLCNGLLLNMSSLRSSYRLLLFLLHLLLLLS